MAVHNIYASSVQNLCHVTILAPRILRWLLEFLKIFAPLLLRVCEQIPCEENFQFLAGHANCILSSTMFEHGRGGFCYRASHCK